MLEPNPIPAKRRKWASIRQRFEHFPKRKPRRISESSATRRIWTWRLGRFESTAKSEVRTWLAINTNKTKRRYWRDEFRDLVELVLFCSLKKQKSITKMIKNKLRTIGSARKIFPISRLYASHHEKHWSFRHKAAAANDHMQNNVSDQFQ